MVIKLLNAVRVTDNAIYEFISYITIKIIKFDAKSEDIEFCNSLNMSYDL